MKRAFYNVRGVRAITQPDASFVKRTDGEPSSPAILGRGRVDLGAAEGAGLLLGVLLLYVVVEVSYVHRLPLVMDEFQGASVLAQLESHVPYRDFAPYKTVLGYYLQLGPFLLGDDTWGRIRTVKLAMVLLNTVALGVSAFCLSRMYSRIAVLAGLVLTVVMSNFLERSSELRVDMMTSWAGLASLLLLLNQRFVAAGIAAGLSFLISQKGIYFWVAGAAALAAPWAFGGAARRDGRPLLRLCVGFVASVAAYAGFWALIAGPDRILESVFTSPARVVLESGYGIGPEMWSQTISRNPVFYGLAVLGIIRLIALPAGQLGRTDEKTLGHYGLALAILAVFGRQPWPYFFVLIIPTAFALIVALLHIHHGESDNWSPFGSSKLIMGLCIAFGILLPVSRIAVNLRRDNGHQRQTVHLAEYVLGFNEMYLAGTDMVYGRRQPVGTLRWIDHARMQMLYQMSPTALSAVIDTLKRSPLKVVIDNYRLARLPAVLREYLAAETTPLWGNLRIYAPTVALGDTAFVLKFAGRYEIQAPPGGTVTIDGHRAAPGVAVGLSGGVHRGESSRGFRLKLLPEGWESQVDEAYRVRRDFFPNVYGY